MAEETKALSEGGPALPVVAIEPTLEKISIPAQIFGKVKRERKKLIVRTWVNVSGQEVAIEEKKVPMGTLDIAIGGNKYGVDYNSVQNVFGQLVYNTAYRVANGALRFTSQSTHDVDAKIRKAMARRDNLTSIWSKWQLPFIACIIAMLVAIVAISVLAVILAQKASVDACMNNETCLANQILQLRAQAEAKAKAGANK